MNAFVVVPLFFATAAAELAGCYLVFLWMHGARAAMLLPGAALSLAAFAWLLSLHPSAGRAYAAYGGVYIVSAVAWGRFVDGRSPDRWDLIGAAVCFLGTLIIVFGPRP